MRSTVERAVAVVGIALVAAAAAANQGWLDRHFLPSFFVPRHWYVWIENAVRIAIGSVGIALVLGRTRLTRVLTVAPSVTVRLVAAAALAIPAGELAARAIHMQATGWLRPEEEPRRQADARLGWVLARSRTGHARIGDRSIDYTIDAAGYRVRRADEPVDPDRPTIVFAGESVMFGEGLTWEESIPAQTGAMLGVQSANLAVHGYGTDQIYMRLAHELPQFRQPVAVVSIFMPELFGRNMDQDRPHLGLGLTWQPAQHESRLKSLATLLVPYREETTVERGIAVTRDVLRATVALARSRGAAPLVITPRFEPEDALQRTLRERIVTSEVPVLFVPLDPDWRLPWNRHPNARAAHVMAAAIAKRLRGQ